MKNRKRCHNTIGITVKEVRYFVSNTKAEVSQLLGATRNLEDRTRDGVQYNDKKKYLKGFINEVTP